MHLVAQSGQLLFRLGIAGCLLCLGELSSGDLLSLVVCVALDLSSLLESISYTLAVRSLPAYRPKSTGIGMEKTYLATTSWYFQPTSCANRPTVQYLRPGFNLSTLRAWGTTMRCFLSYGGGMPSKTFSLSMAAAPRAVLCGIMPRTVL